jgi:hypothetical protein
LGGRSIVKNPGHDIPATVMKQYESHGWAYLQHEGHYKDAALVSEAYSRSLIDGLFEIQHYRESGYQNMDAMLLRRIN